MTDTQADREADRHRPWAIITSVNHDSQSLSPSFRNNNPFQNRANRDAPTDNGHTDNVEESDIENK